MHQTRNAFLAWMAPPRLLMAPPRLLGLRQLDGLISQMQSNTPSNSLHPYVSENFPGADSPVFPAFHRQIQER